MMAAESRPEVSAAERFLLGSVLLQVQDTVQLRSLLAKVLGYDVRPTGDSITIEGVKFTVGREPDGGRTLRAEDPCPTCGDPVRSLPIRRQYDVAAFLLGRHRDQHEHGWLSGE